MAEPSSSSSSPLPARSLGARVPGVRRVERSAGGVVIRVLDEAAHILLIRDPYRKWGLPKGHLEPEESPEDAALREVREETGLTSLVLGPDLGEIDWVFRLKGRKIHKFCRFYLMSAPRGRARPQLAEGITEVRWLPVDQAVATVSYENARGVLVQAAGRIRVPDDEGGLPWMAEGPS